LIVLRPVSYLLFRLTHVVTALTIIKDQIAGLEKGSTDLGNNAVTIGQYLLAFLPLEFQKWMTSDHHEHQEQLFLQALWII
ncbi:hypothetical protein, partial [Vibrio chagasii]|uniref:hypothetical protein n=1 Tax=Vibrio chagasii TaxID=170679 RepID=UPI0019D1E74E